VEVTQLDLPAVHVEFLGYEHLDAPDAHVEHVRRGGAPATTAGASDDEVWVVLDRTPFYAERGGQVGDTGEIVGPHGRMEVRSTRAPVGDVIVHIGRVVEGSISQGDEVRAAVKENARRAIMRHHTATHLLHAALREALGPHVHQAGSLVAPDRLRFDFTHGQPLTSEQRRVVQRHVNDVVLRNVDVRTEIMSLDAAMRSGAVALFDEKYGDAVRVISIDDVSKELCGGTHVRRSGDLGLFILAGESSIGSRIRRIEAYAGTAAEEYVSRQLELLDEAARAGGTTRDDVPARIEQLQTELADQRRRVEAAERRASQQGLGELLGAAQSVPGSNGSAFKLLTAQVDPASAPNMERLREVADWLRDKLGAPSVLLLGSVVDSRPQLLAMVSPALTQRGLDARKLFNEVAQAMGGRGGGRPELAQGGGGDPAKLPQALERGRQAVLSQAA
jgi:alanyl-tRNA synthetase